VLISIIIKPSNIVTANGNKTFVEIDKFENIMGSLINYRADTIKKSLICYNFQKR